MIRRRGKSQAEVEDICDDLGLRKNIFDLKDDPDSGIKNVILIFSYIRGVVTLLKIKYSVWSF